MANTRIQIKRSTATARPADGSLQAGELAYSYNSDKLFIANSTGTGIVEIGGGYYANLAQAAFGRANTSADYSYANAVGAASNTWANNVGTAGNNYTNAADTAGNNYTNAVGTAGNNYALGISTSIGTAGNNYTNAVGTAGNNYATGTFVKLVAGSQTITGDLAITGNLTLLGNATTISSNNLVVGDSLIYLAANNYSGTDILDIGFVANYANGTGANVHTGLIRDATTKQYYLFNGLDIELQANNQAFTPYANGVVNAILNADLIANTITLAGSNVTAALIAGNNYATAVGIAGNNYAILMDTAGNNYTVAVGTAGNNYAIAMDTAGNNYAVAIGAAANAYATSWANTKLANVIAGAGHTVVWTAVNGNVFANISLSTTGVAAATYGGVDRIPSFTVDTFGRITAAGNSIINIDTSTTGTLPVSRGGTGNTSLTVNGVLIGNGTSAITTLYSSTEGHVLQVSSAGAPQYAMLDGGSF